MRRWLSSLLVALLLLVQQGAVLHSLAHAMAAVQVHAAFADGGVPAAEPAEPPCAECLTFAQLANAHTLPQAREGLLAGLGHARPAHAPLAGLALETPATRSRDPPPAA